MVITGLKCRGVVQRVELLFNRFVNGFAVVPRRYTPQAGYAINDFFAVMGSELAPVGRHKHAWVAFKAAVRCERQPLVVHVEILIRHDFSPNEAVKAVKDKPNNLTFWSAFAF